MTRSLAAPLTLLGALACATPAAAGIVVTTEGNVIVGKIDARRGVSDTTIRVTWPYGERQDEGELVADRARIRWFDPEADVLTDAYFEAHLEAPLRGARWVRMREEYLLRQRVEPGVQIEGELPPLELEDPLELEPIEGLGFSIRKPRGWAATWEGEILVLRGPTRPSGFAPRIHVFSVRAAAESYAEQVAWIERELTELATAGAFSVLERPRLERHPAGADQRLRTETRVGERAVRALREVRFRGERTVLFAGYADARDMRGLERLLEACLASWRVAGDPVR